MKNLTWQNPEQLFVAQELINKVKSKCCGIKVNMICNENMQIEISDEDAEKIDSIVNELAPAASGDYAIEDIE